MIPGAFGNNLSVFGMNSSVFGAQLGGANPYANNMFYGMPSLASGPPAGFNPAMGGGFPGGGFGANALGGGFPGAGFGNPMMGGGYGEAQQAMQLISVLLQALTQMAGQRGAQGPFGNMMNQGARGAHGAHGPHGQGNGQGQYIELQKGQTFTTPGGATINWQGDEVKVHEAGGGSQQGGGGPKGASGGAHGAGAGAGSSGARGAQNGNWAFAMAGANSNSAFAMAAAGSYGPACHCACHEGNSSSGSSAPKERDWKVWGDPHKTNPDGSQSEDFTRKNGMFTLQDGTRVVMEADNPKGVVEKVKIFLPGAELGGFDQNNTTNYTDHDSDGKWDNNGNQTVAQAEQAQQFGWNGFNPQMQFA